MNEEIMKSQDQWNQAGILDARPLQERHGNYSSDWSFAYFVYFAVANDHAETGPSHHRAERRWGSFLHFFCAILHLFGWIVF